VIKIKRKTIIMFARVFVAIIIVFGIIIFSEMLKEGIFINVITRHARASFVVIVDLDQRDEFFDQLKRFADTYNFSLHIGQTTPTGDTFAIEMTGEDVRISGNNALHPTRFEIAFYDKKYLGVPVSDEAIDSLLTDLKSIISQTPNVRIFETK